MANSTSKQKGVLLELIVEQLCANYKNARIVRDTNVKGKSSGVERQIDVLIEASYELFDIKIVIEAKNYSKKIGIGIVDEFRTKLEDVGGNFGVIVCPLGFTGGAINAARSYPIQLCQVFDHELSNTAQLIPLRYVVPVVKSYSLSIEEHTTSLGFELPTNTSKWRFIYKENIFDQENLVRYAWNNEMFPQKEGQQVADFGVVKISTTDNLVKFYYLELKVNVTVIADYYLKLFPASSMKNVDSGKGNHILKIDVYSKKEDMLKNGWKYFDTRETMNEAAEPHDTSTDVKQLIMTEGYTL